MVVCIVDSDNSDNSHHNSDSLRIDNQGDEGIGYAGGQNNETTLTYNDLTRILVVSSMRPAICCQKTTTRSCGYIVRPEIRFPRLTGRGAAYLSSLGVIPREVYAKPEEITRVLSMVKGMDEFVSDMASLNLVRKLNGVLKQPRTHEEVKDALQLIEDAIMSEPS